MHRQKLAKRHEPQNSLGKCNYEKYNLSYIKKLKNYYKKT